MIANSMKRCSRCHEWLPLDAFARDKTRPDGLFIYCRACHSKQNKKYNHARNAAIEAAATGRSDCDTCPALKLCRAEIWRPSFNPPCTPGNKFKGNKDCKILVRRGIQAQEET